jgi:uncharacterized protein (PEP-CTERM system associated)
VRRATLLIFATVATVPAWADVQFQPSIAVSTLYVDNLYLVPPGIHTTADEIVQVSPRLQLNELSPRLTGALDYTAQGLWFYDHSDLNAIHNDGVANGLWVASPDLLFVEGRASYTQQPVDPTAPSNQGNLFAVGNAANVFNAMVAPYLKHDFGTVNGTLRYAESITTYSDEGNGAYGSLLQNSRTGIISGRLAADATDAAFSWDVDGHRARTTFTTAEPFVDDRLAVDASVRALPSVRLTATVGAETNLLTHSSSGGLDAPLWALGFKWSPSVRTVLSATVGHRFFGPAYSLDWTHQTRLLNFTLTYKEDVTDAGQSDATANFTPGQITFDPRAYVGVLHSISTYDPYRSKQLDAVLQLTGFHTQLSLRLYDLQRKYLQPTPVQVGNSDSTHGGELTVNRVLNAVDSVRLSAKLDAAEEVDGFSYRDYRYELAYTHRLSRRFDLSFKAIHLIREGTLQYRADIGEISIRESFQ